MKLIYHNIKKQNDVSPFDEALLKVSSNANPLYLASPYIGLSFLKRIVENSTDWRLISDIDAWLSSVNRKHRAKCWEFIVQNIDKIKHFPDIHAKVAIGNECVFLGSANFTDKGVLHRTELSVLIEDPKIVAESIAWFNSLWGNANQPIINEGDELVKALNELLWTQPTARVKLSSSAPKVKSILSSSSRPAGFDVASTFALASIEESVKLLSLEEAYQTISGELFSKAISFSYKELYDLMAELNPTISKLQLWAFVINESTNHWLGGLAANGFDRYVYLNGRYHKWDAKYLHSVNNLDSCLKFVIEKLELDPKNSQLPRDDEWLNLSIPTHQIIQIVSELIDIGLVIETDNAGELEKYSIDPKFEWPKRWQKFHASHIAFLEKISNDKANIILGDEFKEDFDEDFIEDESEYRSNLIAIKSIQISPKNINNDKFQKLKAELNESAIKLNVTKQELTATRDNALSAVFELIKLRRENLNINDVENLISELRKNPLPEKLLESLINKSHGAFTYKKNGLARFSKSWPYFQHLSLYPKSLKIWASLLAGN